MPASWEESQTISNLWRFFFSFCLIKINFHLVKGQAPSNINSHLVTGNLSITASLSHLHSCPIITVGALYSNTPLFREINVLKAMFPWVCSVEHNSQKKIIGERKRASCSCQAPLWNIYHGHLLIKGSRKPFIYDMAIPLIACKVLQT